MPPLLVVNIKFHTKVGSKIRYRPEQLIGKTAPNFLSRSFDDKPYVRCLRRSWGCFYARTLGVLSQRVFCRAYEVKQIIKMSFRMCRAVQTRPKTKPAETVHMPGISSLTVFGYPLLPRPIGLNWNELNKFLCR